MKKGIIGKKIGMTQIFDETGKVIPVTVVEAGPCVVVQKKTVENDGYEAVQLGFGDIRAKRVNKPLAGHFKKADVALKRTLREFRLDDISAVNVGDIVKADAFEVGEIVDVCGTYDQALEQFKTQGNSRYGTRSQTRRLYGRLLFPFENIQGQGNARTPRRGESNDPES